MAVIKAGALYQQVAQEMRKAIAAGRWSPGEKIPTEDKLTALYSVSRPTVRQAVAALRAEGLLDVQQGRGTFVRAQEAAEPISLTRVITRAGKRFITDSDGWAEQGTPTVYRVRLEPSAAVLLHTDGGEAAYLVERMLIHEPGGTRARHGTLMPMEQLTGTPLAKDPAVPTAQAYTQLTAAHGVLEWRETVNARMPQPDERATLNLPEFTPLLISQRVTRTQADHRPLMLETIAMGAGTAQMAFTVRPTTVRAHQG
ncbi:GntR family transcriptional regulator [Streptomyces sp. NPDC092296]|uniref:GntR family transcriptional regulator n=1 Tax=Streptomyces sp. NPDC092296 TaxID=3366012 RepID=UPI0038154481